MYKIGIFSTFPPTQCGIATYSSDLIQNLKINSPELIIKEFVTTQQPLNFDWRGRIKHQKHFLSF